MPIYEYQCAACGNAFEHLLASHKAAPPPCPACGALRPRKQFSTFSATVGKAVSRCSLGRCERAGCDAGQGCHREL